MDDDDAPSDGEIEEGLSSAASTSAFVASSIKSSTALRMSDKNVPVLEAPVKPQPFRVPSLIPRRVPKWPLPFGAVNSAVFLVVCLFHVQSVDPWFR